MGDLKLRIKKTLLKRKVDGAVLSGYYGRVITNGKKSFDEIARQSAKNTTLHPKEAALAAELLLEGVCEEIKNGNIVDLGPLGTIYPAVSGTWKEDPEELALADMSPKVNYRPSDDIAGAVRSASLAWATAKDEEEGEETPDDNEGNGGNGSGNGGNNGDDELEG